MKRPGTCVHFRGIQNVCRTGIDPATVRDASQPGPYRWPCITLGSDGPGATTRCSSYREPTQAEIDADKADLDARLAELMSRSERGECMHCATKVAELKQVGSCVYAEPCGCRQGQGDAKRMRQVMGLT